jgi:hypothetical protein
MNEKSVTPRGKTAGNNAAKGLVGDANFCKAKGNQSAASRSFLL